MSDEKKKPIGALWSAKPMPDGSPKWTGEIEIDGKKYKIAVLKNKFATERRHPELKIWADDREARYSKPAPAPDSQADSWLTDDKDGVPF